LRVARIAFSFQIRHSVKNWLSPGINLGVLNLSAAGCVHYLLVPRENLRRPPDDPGSISDSCMAFGINLHQRVRGLIARVRKSPQVWFHVSMDRSKHPKRLPNTVLRVSSHERINRLLQFQMGRNIVRAITAHRAWRPLAIRFAAAMSQFWPLVC
jgi:hypothetical protein